MVLANLITLARLPLLVVVLAILLYTSTWHWQLLGLVLLGALFLMDWLDGCVARQRREASELGAVLDIALDRTVENVLWIAFLHLGLVSFWVSFLVDGVRGVAFARGKPGFTMMHTRWGRALVASRFMRAFYGVAKGVTFGCLWLVHALGLQDPRYLVSLEPWYQSLVWLTVALCVVRGLPVLLDGRLYFDAGCRQTDAGS